MPARLALAHEEEPRRGQLLEEQPKARQQELMAAVRRQTRDRDDHRRLAELELVAHGKRVGLAGEAPEVCGARNPVDAVRRDTDLAAARLDLARDREERSGAPIEAAGEPVAPHRAEVVKSPHDGRAQAAAEDCTHDQREPVVVRVMGVNDIDPLTVDHGPQPKGVAEDRPGAEPELFDQLEACLPRLHLEPVAGDHAEEDAMAARAQARRELDRRVGAARPPAVGGKVQDRERRHARTARSASRRSSTAPAPIPRMHG